MSLLLSQIGAPPPAASLRTRMLMGLGMVLAVFR